MNNKQRDEKIKKIGDKMQKRADELYTNKKLLQEVDRIVDSFELSLTLFRKKNDDRAIFDLIIGSLVILETNKIININL